LEWDRDMYFIITLTAILAVVFFAALYIIRMLRSARLKSSLKRNIQAGSKETAAEALLELIRKNPFDVDKRFQAVSLFMEIGNYGEAIVQLNSLLSVSRNRGGVDEKRVNGLLAKCHNALGNVDEAFEAYTIMRRIDPTDAEPYIELGRLEMRRDAPNEALKYFKKALSLEPENPAVRREIGVIFYLLERYGDALKVLSLALKNAPQDPEVHFYLAEVQNRLENHSAALKHYLKARIDERFTVSALLNAGMLLRAYDRFDEALKVLALALKTDELDKDRIMEIRYEIAEVYLAQGDINRALKQWERITAHAPDFRDVPAKLEKYRKMKYSSILKAYMMSTQSDFQKLCRRIVMAFASDVVIMRISNQRDSTVEVLAQAYYHHRNVTILFKFFKGSAKVGQLAVREFYEKVRESKATLGICFTSTEYTEDAETFVEGRALELYSGPRFHSILNRVESKEVLQ
jgi:tetratricopeptide (TPR) repeat protein